MSGFEWGRSIGRAQLATGKATQLYNSSQALIHTLDQRRYWARCVRMLNPGMNPILAPEIPDSHCFTKFKRSFCFDYCDATDNWVLNYLDPTAAPQPPNGPSADPEADDGAPSGENDGAPPAGGATAEMVRMLRTRSEETLRLALTKVRATRRLALERLEETLMDARARMEQVRARLRATRDELTAAVLAYIQQEFAEAAERDAFAYARLEVRDVVLAPGIVLKLNSYAFERPRWEDWLFGRLEEEFALLD